MTWYQCAAGFAAGLVIAPVGVSGAVFLLPVQLSVLGVPSPSVTPTNLLFNIVATPGALLRYRGRPHDGLTRELLAGTLPGVVLGTLVRVFAVPGAREFRLVVSAVLLPLGAWLCWQTLKPHRTPPRGRPSSRTIAVLGLAAGVVGGIYGIGGGSLLEPVLAGLGLPLAVVAPAALASTFVTSVVGALTYAVLAVTTTAGSAPQWLLGLSCGVGGLLGGYLGARLQPRVPELLLRRLLGALAVGLALLYVTQAIR
ncbi:TSUP family transporter [Lentzea sp. NBRC 102530]|uniref:TSUP family transporter n=1 Tax=Lentzea sp. NBRC 102530 TaxID=3032201 RepID=UPI0024A321A6|nr:TSUP family transporter [Lentzea sp. NBRC 102530]GLY47700.1 anion permease [Lentzea sp. NBRC 102530]